MHKDSPLPKALNGHFEASAHAGLKSGMTPPKEVIQEERLSVTSSRFEEIEKQGASTPDLCQSEGPAKTPGQAEDLFRNIDYTNMSREELICRSARRVRVMEDGEEVPDISWTEFKRKLLAGSCNKESEGRIEDQVEKRGESEDMAERRRDDGALRGDDGTEGEEAIGSKTQKTGEDKRKDERAGKESGKKGGHSQKHGSLDMSQDVALGLRRSERLAKIKSESACKRKVTPGKSSSKKTPKTRLETDKNS